MPSPQHDGIVRILRKRGHDDTRSLDVQRKELEQAAGMFPVPEGVTVEPVDAGGVPAEWIVPAGVEPVATIVYLHGGGFCRGSLLSHRSFAGRVALAAGGRTLLVDYRLAPEHLHPAAVDDAVAAYRWVLAQGTPANRVVFAGDSAGGGLAVAALLVLRDAGDPLPAGVLAYSPWVDMTLSAPSIEANAAADPVLTPSMLRLDVQRYTGGTNPAAPLVSPKLADLHGLPPLLVFVGTAEILLDDGRGLADRARTAGVDVELHVGEGLVHAWPMMPGVPESEEALATTGAWVARVARGDS